MLLVNEENKDNSRSWMLEGKRIHITKSYKYFGMMMDEKGCEKKV